MQIIFNKICSNQSGFFSPELQANFNQPWSKQCFGTEKTSNIRYMYPFQGEDMVKENGGKIKSCNFLNSCQQ